MKLRVCGQRAPLLRWSVTILATYVTTSLLLSRAPPPTLRPDGDSSSLCRPDMVANMLPPMSDDFNTMIKDLFTYITRPGRRVCRKVLKFGGMAMMGTDKIPFEDGHKYVCLDRELSMASARDCLVYSFGVSIDWSFDWDAESFGCAVFAFDPSINTTTGWQNGTIMFLQYGVGDRDRRTPDGWELRTLGSFVRLLRHDNRTIHYLKVDVENAEWAMLRQQLALAGRSVLARNVEQVGMELHFAGHLPLRKHAFFYVETYQSFLQLQALGFRLFSYEPNLSQKPDLLVPGVPELLTNAMEVVWLKSKCVDRTGGGASA